MVDYYAALGIKKDATGEEIQQAYLRLVRKHDPATTGYSRGSLFYAGQEAYNVLSDEDKKRRYDAAIASASNDWTHFPYQTIASLPKSYDR